MSLAILFSGSMAPEIIVDSNDLMPPLGKIHTSRPAEVSVCSQDQNPHPVALLDLQNACIFCFLTNPFAIGPVLNPIKFFSQYKS